MQDDEKGKHRSSIVWTNHTGNALDSYDDETFNVALNARCPEFYGDVKIASPRYKFPLGLVHATRYTDQRMALIADAAHGIHPIAGQGLNIGLRDVAELTDLLAVSNNNDEDLGSADLLDLYEKRRKPDNVRMIMATDSLNKLFSRRSKSIGAIRKTGLRAVAKLPIAKKFFMTQAMGLKNEKDTAS
jgi:2-octaprenyl-6-methoxyphenol hydroxylase